MKRRYSPEQKKDILNTPKLLDSSITSICKMAGITRKTFYSWKKKYRAGGIRALANQPKVMTRTKSLQKDTRDYILELSQRNPHFSPAALAVNSKADNIPISAATVKKILDSKSLGDINARYMLTEFLYWYRLQKLSKDQVSHLVKNNPCLIDSAFTISDIYFPVFLGLIPINKYLPNIATHIVVFVDLNTLFTKAFLYEGKNVGDIQLFYEEADTFFKHIRPKKPTYIFHTEEVLLKKIPSRPPFIRGANFAAIAPFVDPRPGGFKVVKSKIKKDFVPFAISKNITSLDELQNSLDEWLNDYNNNFKRRLFPNFGKPPVAIAQDFLFESKT